MIKILLVILLSVQIWAGFNFGECSGSGTFQQNIEAYGGDYENTVTVGEIPAGIEGLYIELISDKDVDIRLYGENDDKIVHWPYGLLNGALEATRTYKNTSFTYSGYNGFDKQRGHEFIKVEGSTPTTLTMKAFGYVAGYATVNYSWTGKEGCSVEKEGASSFQQEIPNKAVALVGVIPAGVENLKVDLTSASDLDIQLFGADGTAIVSWNPKGLLSGASKQSIEYHGMTITWSGYNGTEGQKGHEYITISNTTTEALTMKVYGYQAGFADVAYSWGVAANEFTAAFSAGTNTAMFLRKDGSIVEFNKANDYGSYIKSVASTEEFNALAPYTDKIAGAFTWEDKRYYFLNDGTYLRQDPITGFIHSSYPKSTHSNWSGMSGYGDKIIASFISTKATSKLYLFLSTGEYIRYDLNADAVDAGYPKNTGEFWPGLENYSQDIVSAIDYGNGMIYFFLKNKTYLRFNIDNDAVDEGYPKSITSGWENTLGKPEPIEPIHVKASWVGIDDKISILRTDGFLIQDAESTDSQKTLVRDTIPSLAPYWHRIVGAYDNKKGYTYFFLSGGEYLRMSTDTKEISSNYPRTIDYLTWPGLSEYKNDIASVVYWNADYLFFFLKSGYYIKYSLTEDSIVNGYPKEITYGTWPGIGENETKISATVCKGDTMHIFAKNTYQEFSISENKVKNEAPITESIWSHIVPAVATQLSINPFLQLPSSSSMTVRFETEGLTSQAKVYYKEHNAAQYTSIDAVRDTSTSRFMYATINHLKPNQRYDYYVENINAVSYATVSTPEYHFTTYPEGLEAKEVFNFLALSDTQNNSTLGVLKNIVDAVGSYSCGTIDNCDQKLRGITISGDVVNYGASLYQWRHDFFDQMKDITPYVPLIPTPGNHDYYGNSELETYRTMFMLPQNGYQERYYALQIANMRILSLDSYMISSEHGNYTDSYRRQQLAWLKAKLNTYKTDPEVDVVLSIFHHGCLSALWTTGESIGSCENVRALEDFTKESGKNSGHLFGHTHAYSRGFSRDVNHLWLNTASAAGYREKMNASNITSTTRDYDTFSVSSSQFGFTIMTINGENRGSIKLQRYRGTLESKEGGYATLSPVYNEHYDDLTVKHAQIDAPSATHPNSTFSNIENAKLDIYVSDASLVNEVQWQLSTENSFNIDSTVNVWGNMTRKRNIWFQDNGTIEGLDVNTQADANIFQLTLADVHNKHFESDEQHKWDKPDMNTHISEYSPYKDGATPVTINFSPTHTYYWRVRVRDAHMNWSTWSPSYTFTMQ